MFGEAHCRLFQAFGTGGKSWHPETLTRLYLAFAEQILGEILTAICYIKNYLFLLASGLQQSS
jgi:hypothetical protein